MAQGDVLNMSLDDIIKQKSSGPRKQDRKKVRRPKASTSICSASERLTVTSVICHCSQSKFDFPTVRMIVEVGNGTRRG